MTRCALQLVRVIPPVGARGVLRELRRHRVPEMDAELRRLLVESNGVPTALALKLLTAQSVQQTQQREMLEFELKNIDTACERLGFLPAPGLLRAAPHITAWFV